MHPIQLIALDLDGTLIGAEGRIGPRNIAALQAAEQAGIEIVIATGRRHSYALKVTSPIGLGSDTLLVSSNGAVTRTFASTLIERAHMERPVATWLCGQLGEFRNALVITFDKVDPDGHDQRGALVVEELDDLYSSIGKWMQANEAYIERVHPIEACLAGEAPIQMMVCGTVERMRRAEARMLEHQWVSAVGETRAAARISLNRTEYPERDLSIVDILPAGASKGAAILRIAAARGIEPAAIMAIGDNWNDLSMLSVAGYPVLMGNAPDDLLAMAADKGWQMTGHHLEDGVGEAIESVLTVGSYRGSN